MTNTVGDGPYNAWLDPILTDEWQMLGWNNVFRNDQIRYARCFSHTETFDTWSPGYLMFIGATHNGISRLYETFGKWRRGIQKCALCRPANTIAPGTNRIRLCRGQHGRKRNNNNYEQTGIIDRTELFSAR